MSLRVIQSRTRTLLNSVCTFVHFRGRKGAPIKHLPTFLALFMKPRLRQSLTSIVYARNPGNMALTRLKAELACARLVDHFDPTILAGRITFSFALPETRREKKERSLRRPESCFPLSDVTVCMYVTRHYAEIYEWTRSSDPSNSNVATGMFSCGFYISGLNSG